MSNLRERASEIKERGVARRGNFEPTGAPVTAYNYWLRNSKTKRALEIKYGERRENFCHFWRVVAIWAPLMAIKKGIEAVLPFILIALGVISVLVLGYILFASSNTLEIIMYAVGSTAALAAGIFGVLGGISGGLNADQRHMHDMIQDRRVIGASAVVGAPTFVVSYLLTRLGRAYTDWFKKAKHPNIISGVGVALICIIFLTLVGGVEAVGVAFLGLTAIGLGIAACIGIGIWSSDYIDGRRAAAEEAQAEYIAEHGALPVSKPGIVSRFFRGLGDFVIFFAQVVRVNKWKICPTVEVKVDRY